MHDEPLEQTRSIARGARATPPSRGHKLVQLLVELGLADASIMTSFEAGWSAADLAPLLKQLEQSERLSSSQLQLVTEILSQEESTKGDSLADTHTRRTDPAGINETIDLAPARADREHELHGAFGEYRILGEVAQGGMGIVYKAHHDKLNRVVALKVIRAGGFADRNQVARFHQEAKAAARLEHPGIVPVYEVGEVDGRHFYSMAYVDGESLDRLVKRNGPLRPLIAAQLIRLAAIGVQHAHQSSVIHRDIKPANILVTIVSAAVILWVRQNQALQAGW